MARYEHLIFLCQNERAADHPKGSCARRGAADLLDRMKELTHERGLKGRVRVVGSGCLDACADGCAAVALSASSGETWYGGLGPGDADRLFERHVTEGQRLDERVLHERR